MAMTVDSDTLAHILQFYHRPCYREITDYSYAVTTEEEIVDGNNTYYKYTVPAQNIYLDEDGYAVTYAEQKVEDEKVYYLRDGDEFYEYINRYDWERSQETEPMPWLDE